MAAQRVTRALRLVWRQPRAPGRRPRAGGRATRESRLRGWEVGALGLAILAASWFAGLVA